MSYKVMRAIKVSMNDVVDSKTLSDAAKYQRLCGALHVANLLHKTGDVDEYELVDIRGHKDQLELAMDNAAKARRQ